MVLAEYQSPWKDNSWVRTSIPRDIGVSSSVVMFPVPNFRYGCPSLEIDFSNWSILHASDATFFSCSELTAFTSREVADSVKSGQRKNWANLRKFILWRRTLTLAMGPRKIIKICKTSSCSSRPLYHQVLIPTEFKALRLFPWAVCY